MGIILWIIFGAIAGWIASIIMKTNASQGTVWDIVMGVVGAVVGGFLMSLLGQPGVTGFDYYILFEVVGSELCGLPNKVLSSFCVSRRGALKKDWKLPMNTHANILYKLSCKCPIEVD
jgi:uncharacterized membrane protein YeaQ/YmgE (transglycosylase-associated protein family)